MGIGKVFAGIDVLDGINAVYTEFTRYLRPPEFAQ